MILQSLVNLAEKENLLADEDFEWKPVAWIVDVDEVGNILDVIGTHYTPEGAKKDVPRKIRIPRSRGKRSSGIQPEFLVDNSKYLFGFWPADKKEKNKRINQALDEMQNDIHEAAEATKAVGLNAQLECVRAVRCSPNHLFSIWGTRDENNGQWVEHISGERFLITKLWASNDLFAFRHDGKYVFRDERVKRYWTSLRKPSADKRKVICLVTGDLTTPVDKHVPLRVIGATTSGAPLISFNASAFESYGLSRNENAPIGSEAGLKYGVALRRLLDRDGWPHPTEDDLKLPRGNMILPGGVTVLFWCEEQQDLMDWFLQATDAQPNAVRSLYGSVWNGRQIEIEDTTPFHTLLLSGSQGRIIVREAITTTVGKVVNCLKKHFDDLDIIPLRTTDDPYPSLYRLLQSIKPPGDTSDTPPALTTGFYVSAISGLPYPSQILALAMGRIRARAGVSTKRAALLKACLNRSHRRGFLTFSFKILEREMDLENKTAPYRLGRLFAVLEKIQQEAIDAKAGVVDRYLSSACGTPALVFPRLLSMHHHHLGKLTNGREIYFGRVVDEILSPLPGAFPRTLSLEQQGVFMIGYHHQRADLWKKKNEFTDNKEEASAS